MRGRENVSRGRQTRNASACLVSLVRDVTGQLASGEAVRRRASSLCVLRWQVSSEQGASEALLRAAEEALDLEGEESS